MINYKRSFFTMLVSVFFVSSAFSQAPDTLWTNSFGDFHEEKAYSLIEDFDGNLVIGGHTRSNEDEDYNPYLLKVDLEGNVIWEFQVELESTQSIESTIINSDGDYVMTGNTYNGDSLGTDILILKVDEHGDLLWMNVFDNLGIDRSSSICQDVEGNYLITGHKMTGTAATKDIALLKVSDSGELIYRRVYDFEDNDFATDIIPTSDGNAVIAARWNLDPSMYDYRGFIMKINLEGDTLWTSTSSSPRNGISSVKETDDGNFIVGGNSVNQFGDGVYLYISEISSTGEILWSSEYGDDRISTCKDIIQTNDGGYLITGFTDGFNAVHEDIFLLKTDEVGDTLWSKRLPGSSVELAYDACQTEDDRIYVCGVNSFAGQNYDVYLICLDNENSITGSSTESPASYRLMEVYPNPFNSYCKIKMNVPVDQISLLTLYDINGRKLKNINSFISSGSRNEFEFDGSQLSSGTYFISAEINNHQHISTKIVLVK